MTPPPASDLIKGLQAHDTPTLANAIESFGVRLRNEGFTNSSIRCLSPRDVPMVGYAVTVRIRCSNPPKDGHPYADRTDWWKCMAEFPAPRIAVIEDVDERPGTGSFVGAVHAGILHALGCVGIVTNGAVRDLPAIEATGMQVHAGSLAVSHAYAHIVDFGKPAKIAGLEIKTGDLLHADRHGVLSVPKEIAASLPQAAEAILAREAEVLAICRSRDFTLEKLRDAVKGVTH